MVKIIKKLYVGENNTYSTSYEKALELGAQGFKHVYDATYGDIYEHYVFITKEPMDVIEDILEELLELNNGDIYTLEDGTILKVEEVI